MISGLAQNCDEIFCCIHLEKRLDKRGKDKIKLQNNFLRAGENLI